MNTSTVISNGKRINTLDNPTNTFVRSLADGKFYRVDRIAVIRGRVLSAGK